MLDKPDALNTVGLLILSDSIKGAKLSVNKGKPKVEDLFELPIEGNNKIVKNLASKNLIVTSLTANETIVRQLEIKLKKDADVDAVIGFQSEPLLPIPLDNAIVDWIKLQQGSESTLTTIVAARKDYIQKHVDVLNNLDIDVEVISCVPCALALFSRAFLETIEFHYVVDIGLSQTSCVLVKEGKLIAAQAFSQGSQNLQSENAETAITNIPAFHAFRLELMRTLFGLSKHAKGKEVSGLLITGEASLIPQFSQNLCQQLEKNQLSLSRADEKPEVLSYAIPIGLALSAQPNLASDQINFRQQEFTYPNPWKRYVKPVGTYLALCCALALSIYLFGNAYTAQKTDRLRQDYVALLASMHKQQDTFEAEFTKKTGIKPSLTDEAVPSAKDLSEDEIADRLRFLEKEVSSTPETYALLPNVPRVSDVLAWLQSHPNVTFRDKNTNTVTPLLQLDSFSYTFVKRPDNAKRQEKYQVKVEIEFGTQTPKQAREFHDALLSPNDFVDPKGEVKWTTNRGKYRASFFLKDRTTYSSG